MQGNFYWYRLHFIADRPFTILAPKNTAGSRDGTVLHQPELVKKLLLDHVVLGSQIDLTNITTETSFLTLSGRTVHVRPLKEGKLAANNATVIEPKVNNLYITYQLVQEHTYRVP